MQPQTIANLLRENVIQNKKNISDETNKVFSKKNHKEGKH